MGRFRVLFFFFVVLISSGRGAETVPECSDLLSGRNLQTVAMKLHGGQPLKPTKKSLLGQYLARTGVEARVHRFLKNDGNKKGPEKLIVAVTPESFPVFKELFGDNNANVLEHLHTPNQGTLIVRWRDKIFSYASAEETWRFPTSGTIGPMILLRDSEVLRLHQYWTLNKSDSELCRQPWDMSGYRYPKDAYGDNCTAWFGHIPLGDRTSRRIVSPGSLDIHGDRQGSAPRKGTLKKYRIPQKSETELDAALYQKVWQVDLNLRLFDLLQVPFELANHTNPGWVAITLTSLANIRRVPFVAVYVNRRKGNGALPDPFCPEINPI